MPQPPHRPRELQWQVFVGASIVDRGLLTTHQLRGDAWISPLHGVYADARLERDHGLRCRAVLLRILPGTTLAGVSAAWLHGVEFAAEYGDDVHVIAPAGGRLSTPQGIRAHHTALGLLEVTTRQGLRCTTGVRTAWDLALWLETIRAVPLIDALLRLGVTSRAELLKLAGERAEVRGVRRASLVFALVDAGAESPQESRLRVRFVLAGLPRPVTQFPVTVRSGRVLHPDLAWPEFKVAVEYDGEWHAGTDQFHTDRRRLNQLVAEGWIVLHVTSRRMRELHTVVSEVRQALRSRGWRG